MEDLLQPQHLIFILLIVLILFGPRNLPDVGRGFRRGISDLLGSRSSYRGALFMAKGVDPGVGRDVGDMLPDEDARRSNILGQCLLAILLGNTLYFASSPILPAAARMEPGASFGLPVLVDLWFCVFVFGVFNLATLLRKRNKPRK